MRQGNISHRILVLFFPLCCFLTAGCVEKKVSTEDKPVLEEAPEEAEVQETAYPEGLDGGIMRMAEELTGAVAESGRLKVAVVEFSELTGRSLPLCLYLAESLTSELASKGQVDVVERRMLQKVMEEQEFQSSDITTSEKINLGRILEVDWIITGTIADLGHEVEFNTRALSVNTGRVASASKVRVPRDEVARLMIPVPEEGEQPPEHVPAPSSDALSITASFVSSLKTPHGSQVVSILPGAVLYSGDQIKVLFRSNRDCHVYILQYGSTGRASVIFPNRTIALSNRVNGGVDYYIPPSDQWFFLDDNPGRESIYLIASLDPVADLDHLLLRLSSGREDQLAVSDSISRVLDDIFTRGPGSAEPPVGTTGTAGYSQRDIGGVNQGPAVPVINSDGSQGHAQSFTIQGKKMVGRHISFEHR